MLATDCFYNADNTCYFKIFSTLSDCYMTSSSVPYSRVQGPRIFYGWTILAVGFLSHIVCTFHMSSTLSVFFKPLTEDLQVSRGLFSLLRSGEIVIGAAMAPFVGPLVDRSGGRWLMGGGALVAGAGFLLLGRVSLGTVRGLGIFISHTIGAAGAAVLWFPP